MKLNRFQAGWHMLFSNCASLDSYPLYKTSCRSVSPVMLQLAICKAEVMLLPLPVPAFQTASCV